MIQKKKSSLLSTHEVRTEFGQMSFKELFPLHSFKVYIAPRVHTVPSDFLPPSRDKHVGEGGVACVCLSACQPCDDVVMCPGGRHLHPEPAGICSSTPMTPFRDRAAEDMI